MFFIQLRPNTDLTFCPHLLPLPDQTLDRRELIDALTHLKPSGDWPMVARRGALGEKLRECWCKSGTLSIVTDIKKYLEAMKNLAV